MKEWFQRTGDNADHCTAVRADFLRQQIRAYVSEAEFAELYDEPIETPGAKSRA